MTQVLSNHLKQIIELSEKEACNISSKVIKLSEEVGEVSAEYLAFAGTSNRSASAEGKIENLLEEAIDVFIVAVDLINTIPLSSETTTKILAKKLKKWEAKQNK